MLSKPGPADRSTKTYAAVYILISLLTWIVFKCLYPYADYFTDSYTYIQAAAAQDAISFRPIGYSLFLRLVHIFSTSDTVLVTIQYGMVQLGCWLLFCRIKRLYHLSVWRTRALLVFFLVNPLVHYLSNYVSSDALFLFLSICWLLTLMRQVERPSWDSLITQVILLILIFNIRFVALYYPIISALAFVVIPPNPAIWKPGGRGFKIVGILASVAVIFAGTRVLRAITLKETGTATYSGFSGWQIANNSLNMYPYIPVDTADFPTPETRELAGYVKAYFDTAGAEIKKHPHIAVTDYMWIRTLPLHRYMAARQAREHLSYFIAWHRVSTVFNQYGIILARRHPIAYFEYYIWPSAMGFFSSPLDVFSVYNEGHEKVDQVAGDWFHYKTLKPKLYSPTMQARLLAPMPTIVLLLNGIFLVNLILVWWKRKSISGDQPRATGQPQASVDPSPSLRSQPRGASAALTCFWIAAGYILVNAGFSIIASPTVFRYQVLPMILLFSFSMAATSLRTRRTNSEPDRTNI